MAVYLAAGLTLVLVGATVLIHYEVLGGTQRFIPHSSLSPRTNVMLVIGAIFFAHLIETCLFALAYYLLQGRFGLGSIAGELSGSWLDFFYFSVTCYTTLGVGDVVPQGQMRVIAAVESLTGLVLIGWSASFTYLMMESSWKSRDGPAPPA